MISRRIAPNVFACISSERCLSNQIRPVAGAKDTQSARSFTLGSHPGPAVHADPGDFDMSPSHSVIIIFII